MGIQKTYRPLISRDGRAIDGIHILNAGPIVAAVGTSFEDGAGRDILPPDANPSRAFMNDGWLTWFRDLTFQRVNLPVEYILGASGTSWNTPGTGISAQIEQVIRLNPRPTFCIVGGEPNDLGANRTYDEIKRDWLAGVKRLQISGILPVVCTTIPKGTNSFTAERLATMIRLNNFKREYCYANRDVLLIDPWRYMADQTSATSNALSGMIKSSDNLHPATPGAYWWGKAAADVFNTLLPPAQWTQYLAAADYWSANNPTGNLLFSGTANYGLMAGTGGTQTANAGLTHVGTTATGATELRGSATSTCTWTHGKEAYPNRNSGERQTEQIAATSGGGADEQYNTRLTPTFANFSVGDWVYAEAAIEVTGAPVRVTALELYMLQTRPTNSFTAADGLLNSATAGFLPTTTWDSVMRTPPIQIQSDATAVTLNIRARLDASAGNASITYKIGDVQLRKVAA